ncbi:PliI family lysozyme inhibitor of I-type lysozyme [Desulfobulbus sp.]|uniref:PliI family lysozyme inhibitor of I-type lysozyme n=1 Tax=Desulfobulbus sp. TaxID=895 RepID=UPI00286FAA55|nr:PliI family lysozyme inhibitor of I-type lysozyme [Desulfobulbus sp.]
MINIKTLTIAVALLLPAPLLAAAQDRFVAKVKLPTGQTAVVAEGDFEARSLGSFSVRLYEAAPAPDETTFFIAGLIRPRDGVIEKTLLADIDGDRQPELIVVVRSAGTGGYLSAHAFAFAKDHLLFRAQAEDLAADADPVPALRQAADKRS